MGSRPVAKGSRVPVWPAFTPPNRRRARPSAALEENPAGLSSNSTPATFKPGRFMRSGSVLGVVGDGVVDQLGKTHATLDGSVVFEVQARDSTNGQAVGQFRAQKTGGTVQPM